MHRETAPQDAAAPEPAPPEPAATVGDLLRDRNYLTFWCAGLLIGVVRWFQLLALSVYTLGITGSPFLVSLVPLLYMAPMALCGPMLGAIADRVDRKRMFAVSLLLVGLTSLAMAGLAWQGDLGFGHIGVAAFLNGVFWATDMPIRRRLLGDLSGGALAAAMSLDAATGNATRALGPLLGGAVLQFLGVFGVFAVGAAAYGVCLLLTVGLKVGAQAARSVPTSLASDLIAGVRHVLADRRLRHILAVTVVFNVCGFPFTAMIPVIGRRWLELDAVWVGAITSLEGLGAFLGAIFVAIAARPASYFPLYWIGTTVYIAMVGLLGILAFSARPGALDDFMAISTTLLIAGMAGACFAAMQSTLTYLSAPTHLRSRVLGVLTLCIGTAPLGFLNVGWMADAWGAPTALIVQAAEGAALLLLLRAVRPSNI